MIGAALWCLDTALVNLALPTIARDLNVSPAIVGPHRNASPLPLNPSATRSFQGNNLTINVGGCAVVSYDRIAPQVCIAR